MANFLRFYLLLLSFCVWFSAEDAAAQNPLVNTPIPFISSIPSAPVVEHAPLDPIVVFNSEGKRLLYLKGWSLNDVDDFWKFFTLGQKNPLPSFNLQEISVIGKVVGNRVEAEIRITLTAFNDRPVIVPLGMKEGILPFATAEPVDQVGQLVQPVGRKKPFSCNGPGFFDLAVDPLSGQYLAILHPKESPARTETVTAQTAVRDISVFPLPPSENSEEQPSNNVANTNKAENEKGEKVRLEQRYELILSLWFPLDRIGNDENRLTVSFPQAVSSLFVLNVAEKGIVAAAVQGTLLDSYEIPNEPITQFKIHGLGSDFELSWRKRKAEPMVEDRPVLYVEEASIKVQLESKSTVYDAILPVRTLPSSGFDRLRIRLPQGTTLDRETTEKYAVEGYSFEIIKKEPDKNESEMSQVIEFRLPRKTSGPVNIRLKAVQQFDVEKTDIWRDLSGFEVIGAERQFGSLTLTIPADMRPSWKPIRGIRRTEIPDSAVQEGIDARFEFSSQPFLLQGKIVTPQPRTNVKPEYQISINKGSLLLTARFTYEVLGSKTENLSIRLPGWKWSGEIKPSNLVDTVGVEQDENGLLNIPLRVPTDGSFEIELKAYQPISAEEGEGKRRLTFSIPQPLATWNEPAPVAIVPADNVEVIPIDEDADIPADASANADTASNNTGAEKTESNAFAKQTIGLTRRSRRSQTIRIDIPDRQQEPLFYMTEPVEAVFVANIRYLQQKTAATLRTDIRLRDQSDQVDQVISYNVSYVPVDKLYFLVPKSLEESGNLQVKIGNRPLELRDVAPNGGSGEQAGMPVRDPENWSRKLIMLPETLFKFQLVFRYSIPQVNVEHDMVVLFSLPFIQPVETFIADHRVNVIVPPGYRIELHNDVHQQWDAAALDSSTPGTSFQSALQPERISLQISLSDRDALGTMVIERAWQQTWLTGTLRQDRCVYLINSDRESIEMTLPPETDKTKKVFVYIDHHLVLADVSPKGELTIPLTPEQRRRLVFVEVVYRFPFETPQRTIALNLPHFGTDSLVRCEYWQIILPQNRHILGVPAGWTPEYHWMWNGLFLGRVPSLQKKDVGLPDDSSENLPIATESNQYLFSSLQPVSEASIYVVDRSLIVLFSSGLSLFIGLVLIYFPRTRYAGSLFGLGIALLTVILYRPAPVFLMLQASSFGVFLALGAGCVYRIVYREEKWILPVTRTWKDADEPSEVYSVIVDEESETEKKNEKET